jgi:outer membrane protein TolC
MSAAPLARLLAVAIVTSSSVTAADPLALDLSTALDRAHRFAPEAIAVRGQVAEAEAGKVGAALAFTTNPELEVGAGPRFTDVRQVDLEARLEQELEPWRRDPRRRLARVEADHARADGDAQLRELDLAVAFAFYDALAADSSVAIARHAAELAELGATVADRRRKAGDITDLDANLARVALGRARSAMQAELAERARSVATLAALVGAAPTDDIALRGDLTPLPAPPQAATLAGRSDVRALDAEREVAIAERSNAAASARPALAVWASYQREDATSIVLGGLRLTLPIWNSADGEQAIARAKERRVTDTRAAVLTVAARQVADALAAYEATRRALATFETEVAPILDDSERLLQKSVDAGQIATADFLVIRQELATGRRDQLERRLALAKAAVVLRYAAGVSP